MVRNRNCYFVQYHQRVLALDPIAYWLLNEKQGTTAYDWVSGRAAGAQNASYTGVTLGQAGIGDGNTCPLFDGANDYCNILTATFSGTFNGSEGSAMIWARVANAGVWTDGARRDALILQAGPNDYVLMTKRAVNNLFSWYYVANGVPKAVGLAGLTTTSWMTMAITWSASADRVCYYYNGASAAPPQNGLGVWGGGGLATAVIGASNLLPQQVWNGILAHCAVWDSALDATVIADLAAI